ncbi:Nuclease-related domain-containing protein [Amphibacillus marinus]|uniref:Nuclease-related domain-containing protein n=1 Tax=Amphibacillus marinus TaxID=872970 RepID=A0A1H8N2Z7_9BACI|nr:nuclease-related domain-containing protein [Amphibacillus marinus]SEO23828.1 Nuclease-related domain-containing protein [Amphibacillus marinus]
MKRNITRKSKQLLQLEVLLARLSSNYPKYYKIKEQHARELAGYLGESSLYYHFNFLEITDGYHLTSIRIRGKQFYFQIDHLILTQCVCFIIEVKHRKGLVKCSERGQYIQEYNGQQKVFEDPYLQALIQKKQLEYLLAIHNFPLLPIHPIVVFSHDQSLLDTSIQTPNVVTLQQFADYLNETYRSYKQVFINKHTLKSLNQLLIESNTQLTTNLQERYLIKKTDLKLGVLCQSCKQNILMRCLVGNWECPRCLTKDKLAHKDALRHFAVLYKPTIMNHEAKWWLKLDSANTSYRLLKQTAKSYTGKNKGRIYDLSNLIT